MAGAKDLGDSVSVEDFQNSRIGRRLVGSVDINVQPSVDEVQAHPLSLLINSRAILWLQFAVQGSAHGMLQHFSYSN